jgi:cysteinyl-tRNA synthetase
MSKSLGNFFTLSEIFAKYHPSAVRYMLLSVHYRSPLDFSQDVLEQARNTLTGMKDAIARANRVLQKQKLGMDEADAPLPQVVKALDQLKAEYHAAMTDDFNTPGALGVLHRMLGQLERQFTTNTVSRASVRYVLNTIRSCSTLLGIDIFSMMQDVLIPTDVTDMCHQRETARVSKNWSESDRLRKAISERGYVVEDTPQGPRILPKAGS